MAMQFQQKTAEWMDCGLLNLIFFVRMVMDGHDGGAGVGMIQRQGTCG